MAGKTLFAHGSPVTLQAALTPWLGSIAHKPDVLMPEALQVACHLTGALDVIGENGINRALLAITYQVVSKHHERFCPALETI
jgi:hypothetical protein